MSSIYRELCSDILALDGVVSTTILSMDGNVLYSEHKAGIEPLLSKQDAEASIFRAAIRMGTRKEFLDKLGGINYALTDYGKLVQYTIPLDREVKTLLLVSEGKVDGVPNHLNGHSKMPDISRIVQILKRHDTR